MSLKKLIQAGTGIAVLLGTAGTANALNLAVTTIADKATGFTEKAPLKYASEMQQGTTKGALNDRDETTVVAAFDVTSGAFPSGNVVVTATISGATFDSAVSGAALDFKNCKGGTATSSLSSGGAEGGTTVAWVVSNLNACGSKEQALVSLPIDLDLGGAGVSLSVGIVTESGSTPVDGGPASVSNFLVSAPAYSAEIKAGTTLTANVTEATGAYKKFVGPAVTGSLGTVQLKADTAVAINLGTAVVNAAVADYDKVAIVATGDFSAFLETAPTDNITLGTTAATAKTATTATFSAVEGGAFGSAFTGAAALEVATDGDTAIPASAYSVTVTPTLEAGLTGLTAAPTTKAVGSIARNGTSVRLPWVVSGTQAGVSGTGAVNYIRVTNRTATGFGPITATVLASNQSASLGKSATLAASLAAGGELVVDSETLETLLGANYGRGDIEVTVEGAGATVVQLVARPDGVYTIDNSPN